MIVVETSLLPAPLPPPRGRATLPGSFVPHEERSMFRRAAASGAVLLLAFVVALAQDTKPKVVYKHGPHSEVQRGVRAGKVEKMEAWKSKAFPDTVRDWWIYVPAQYEADKPACVMVFQDGNSYQNPKGDYRAPVVFDNLIHQKKMPVTIGIFI